MSAAVTFKRFKARSDETKEKTQEVSAMSNILQQKHAVVFGAGGSIGAAVAKEFAAQCADVYLAGRTKSNVEQVMKQIIAAGGHAEAAVVDALDDAAVNQYMDGVAKRAGSIDIAFNATGPLVTEYGNGKSAAELTIEEWGYLLHSTNHNMM